MDMSLFKKIDVKVNTPARGRYVRIKKEGSIIFFSAEIVEAANLNPSDKVDLYRLGSTFAFKKEKAGVMTLTKVTKTSYQLCIRNRSAYLEIAPFSKGQTMFDAWVEDGVVFFKPKEV